MADATFSSRSAQASAIRAMLSPARPAMARSRWTASSTSSDR